MASKVVSAVEVITVAMEAVRNFRAGTASASVVSEVVKDLTDLQLEIVADGARIKLKTLKALRDLQMKLPL